jgi:hypothetical protein
MLDAILDTIGGIIRATPCETVATAAVLVGGGGLILTGWRHLVRGILDLFAAFSAIVNAMFTFFGAILSAFGFTLGGLIFLALGVVAIRCAFVLLSGG